MIEYGRYGNTKIPKENRLCLVFESGQIENEIHLIFSCNSYNNLRANMIQGFIRTKRGPYHHNQETNLNEILQSKDLLVIRLFCSFIAKCFHQRNLKLDTSIRK